MKSLINNKQPAGYHSIKWDATNNFGEPVSAGMYIYMIQAGEFRQVRKNSATYNSLLIDSN